MALHGTLVKSVTMAPDFTFRHAHQYFLDKADHHLKVLVAYAKSNNIDLTALHQRDIVLGVFQVVFDGAGFFRFAGDKEAGTAAIITEVKGEDDMDVVDLVAWDIAKPELFGCYEGMPVLGIANASNPATWSFAGALFVHRTPLGWAQAGGKGVVILQHEYAYRCFDDNLGPLLCEDQAHASEVHKMLSPPPFDSTKILF